MTEFLNYKVVLDLKDGTKTQGIISHVDETSITLGNKTITNSLVKDLKVVQLPPDHKQPKKRQASNISQMDDAIVPVSKSSSRSNTPRLSKQTVQPGWGTRNEIEDIKASEDFDFAANLAMFDKKSAFADFQRNDTVSVQDRLVGLNKAPGAVKQKAPEKKDKYENDEMVIPKNKQDNWSKIGSVSRKLALPVAPGTSTLGGQFKASRELQLFRFLFENTGAAVPLATPVQLFEIEREVQMSYGIDSKVFVETCATNLYKLIVDNLLGGSVRLSNRKNHNLPPLVLLLIGNSRSSSRAFAVGRHLTNHGVRVLAYAGNEDIVDEELLYQCQLFEKCGGKVVSSAFSELLDILHNQLETPVEVIIDSLQGFDGLLADMYEAEESIRSLKQLVLWVNEPKQKSKVLSLDIPSGVDGGSGTVQDSHLQIHGKYIVSLGLPITGLVHAYNNGILHADEVQHVVIDSGIPNSLYQSRSHLRKFDKFWYCAEQYVKLKPVSEPLET